LYSLVFPLSSTYLWRRGTGRGGSLLDGSELHGQEVPLSLSLSPLTRGEGIEKGAGAKTLPKTEVRKATAPASNSPGRLGEAYLPT